MGKNQLQSIGILVQTLLVLLLLAPNLTFALSAGGIGIVPNVTEQFPDRGGWFLYEVDPNQVIEDQAIIINTNNRPVHVIVEPFDAFLTQDGSFSLLGELADNQDIGLWIELEKSEFDIEANSQIIINFTIHVPEKTEVGDHIGGLAIHEMDKEPENIIKTGGTRVGITTRVGARIYLTVAGDIIRDWQIKRKSFFGQNENMMFRFLIKNKGNIRANLKISEGKIYNIFGLYDKQEDIDLIQVFPKKTVTTTLTWSGKKKPLFGPHLAVFTIEDLYKQINPNSNIFIPPVKPITIWMLTFFLPYTQLVILLGVAFVFWFLYRFITWKRFSMLASQPVKKYKIKKSDSLVQISSNHNMSWKLVARLNNIPAPYSLHNIKELYIPDARGVHRGVPVVSFWRYGLKPLTSLWNKISKRAEYIIVIDKGDKKKSIEDFTKMPWERIAKYNNLSEKFRLKAGIELKVPGKKK